MESIQNYTKINTRTKLQATDHNPPNNIRNCINNITKKLKFWLPKTSKITPNSLKIAPQSAPKTHWRSELVLKDFMGTFVTPKGLPKSPKNHKKLMQKRY